MGRLMEVFKGHTTLRNSIAMKEEQVKKLGFELVKEYEHDQWITRRYANEVLEVEFTYGWEGLVSCDMTIDDVVGKTVSFDQLKTLTNILC